MRKIVDMTGQKLGRLTVISRAESGKRGQARWNCVCDCGGKITTDGSELRRGRTTSCGCLGKERRKEANLTHGKRGIPTYRVWAGMKNRCTNPNNPSYGYYGGRGIAVCERWDKFENFLADMGEEPEGMSIERKDNNGNYSPENCIYATQKEQTRNTRYNRIIKYGGREQCIADWAIELGISYGTLWRRLREYPPQTALNM